MAISSAELVATVAGAIISLRAGEKEFRATHRIARGSPAPYDSSGIPQLDYHGRIGWQYHPSLLHNTDWTITTCSVTPATQRGERCFYCDWLTPPGAERPWHPGLESSLRLGVSRHSGSAVVFGTGPGGKFQSSCAHEESGDSNHLDAALAALASFSEPISGGGDAFTDDPGYLWFEEYIVSPRTHILNGFIGAARGIYDCFLATKYHAAQGRFSRAVQTLLHNLDVGTPAVVKI